MLFSSKYEHIATILNSIVDILNIKVSERGQSHKCMYFMIPFKSSTNKGEVILPC